MAEDVAGSEQEADIVEVLDTNFNDSPNATEIMQKFQELVQNDELLDNASKYLLDELISDAIFGVFLEVHHLRKTGNLVALDGHPENCDNFDLTVSNNNSNTSSSTILPLNSSLHANTTNTNTTITTTTTTTTGSHNNSSSMSSTLPTSIAAIITTTTSSSTITTTTTSTSLRIVDLPNYDIFGMSTAKKPIDCTCPNCDRLVSAARFAPHLEKCMGMGRLSSRIASRRLATKEVNSNSNSLSANSLNSNSSLTLAASYLQQSGIPTDDEDDIEWSSSSFEKRRKKINQNTRNNGTKKNNGKTC